MKTVIAAPLAFLAGLFIVCTWSEASAQSLLLATPATVEPASKTEGPERAVTIPAGTKVLMSLISPLHTVSASSESGLYLETIMDVVGENRVVIPARTRVQGSVTRANRPGRVRGRAHLQFHFSTMILPNNYVLPISGSLESFPGSSRYEKKQEGMIQPVDQIDKDVAAIVASAAGGAAIGSISYGGVRTGTGALIGAGVGLGKVLFTRGDDIRLNEGARVEMILDRAVSVPLPELTFPPKKSEVPTSLEMHSDEPVPQNPSRKRTRLGWEAIIFPY